MHLCIILCVGVGGVPRYIGDYKRTIWTWGWDLGYQTWQQVPFTHCTTILLAPFPTHPHPSQVIRVLYKATANRTEHGERTLLAIWPPPLISGNTYRTVTRTHARGQSQKVQTQAYLNQSSLLTTAAISAPVLWFKAASTIEAIKKKKVLSPVLTKS